MVHVLPLTWLLDRGLGCIMLLPIHSYCSWVLGNHKGAGHLHEGTAVLHLEVKDVRQLQPCRFSAGFMQARNLQYVWFHAS